MSITVKKIALTECQSEPQGPLFNQHCLQLLGNLPVTCQIQLGTVTLSIAALQALQRGQTLALSQKIEEPLEIILHNQVIARGELMSHEEHFAIRITEVGS
jgi:flagellar motor switch protein FliN